MIVEAHKCYLVLLMELWAYTYFNSKVFCGKLERKVTPDLAHNIIRPKKVHELQIRSDVMWNESTEKWMKIEKM